MIVRGRTPAAGLGGAAGAASAADNEKTHNVVVKSKAPRTFFQTSRRGTSRTAADVDSR